MEEKIAGIVRYSSRLESERNLYKHILLEE
jgi:hypothetical protein